MIKPLDLPENAGVKVAFTVQKIYRAPGYNRAFL